MVDDAFLEPQFWEGSTWAAEWNHAENLPEVDMVGDNFYSRSASLKRYMAQMASFLA